MSGWRWVWVDDDEPPSDAGGAVAIYAALADAVRAIEHDATLHALEDEAMALAERRADPELRIAVARALALHLAEVRAQRVTLARAEAGIERALARVMPTNTLDLEGVHVERHSGRKRTEWDHDGLLHALADCFAVDPETGEVDETLRPLFADAVRFFTRAAQVSGYRTRSGLVPLGVDPDQYCRTEPGRPSIELVVGESAAAGGEAA
jgi:hypothetical protein